MNQNLTGMLRHEELKQEKGRPTCYCRGVPNKVTSERIGGLWVQLGSLCSALNETGSNRARLGQTGHDASRRYESLTLQTLINSLV